MDKELAEIYAQRIRDGSEPPPLVLWKPGPRSKFILVDGNHQYFARSACRRRHADAYIINCQDQQVIHRITWTFNDLVNGKQLLPEERLEHAITFVRMYGADATTVAKEHGVNKHTLASRLAALQVKEVLERNKVNTDRLTDNQLRNLQPILKVGEDVLARAGKIVAESGLNEKQIMTMCKEIGKSKTQKDKLEALDIFDKSEEVRVTRAETKGGRVKKASPSPRDRLMRLMIETQHLFEDFREKGALRPAGKEAFEKMREVAVDLVEGYTRVFILDLRKGVG